MRQSRWWNNVCVGDDGIAQFCDGPFDYFRRFATYQQCALCIKDLPGTGVGPELLPPQGPPKLLLPAVKYSRHVEGHFRRAFLHLLDMFLNLPML